MTPRPAAEPYRTAKLVDPSQAGNRRREDFVARSATPSPCGSSFWQRYRGDRSSDPDKDAEKARAAWARRLAETRGSCSLQSKAEHVLAEAGPQGGSKFHYLSANSAQDDGLGRGPRGERWLTWRCATL